MSHDEKVQKLLENAKYYDIVWADCLAQALAIENLDATLAEKFRVVAYASRDVANYLRTRIEK